MADVGRGGAELYIAACHASTTVLHAAPLPSCAPLPASRRPHSTHVATAKWRIKTQAPQAPTVSAPCFSGTPFFQSDWRK